MNKKAFSFIEVLLATSILGTVSFLGLQAFKKGNNSTQEHKSELDLIYLHNEIRQALKSNDSCKNTFAPIEIHSIYHDKTTIDKIYQGDKVKWETNKKYTQGPYGYKILNIYLDTREDARNTFVQQSTDDSNYEKETGHIPLVIQYQREIDQKNKFRSIDLKFTLDRTWKENDEDNNEGAKVKSCKSSAGPKSSDPLGEEKFNYWSYCGYFTCPQHLLQVNTRVGIGTGEKEIDPNTWLKVHGPIGMILQEIPPDPLDANLNERITALYKSNPSNGEHLLVFSDYSHPSDSYPYKQNLFIGEKTMGTFVGTTNDPVPITALDKVDSTISIGNEAGQRNNRGDYNLFIGHQAGWRSGHSDYSATLSVNENLFIGYQAGLKNETGSHNISIGARAGLMQVKNERNIFIGYQAAKDYNPVGQDAYEHNIIIGSERAQNRQYFNSNIYIGYKAGSLDSRSSSPSDLFNIYIGANTGNGHKIKKEQILIGHGVNSKSRLYSNTDYYFNIANLIFGTSTNNPKSVTFGCDLISDRPKNTTTRQGLRVFGGIRVGDKYWQVSDKRIKEEIEPCHKSIVKNFENIPGRSFVWKNSHPKDRSLGFIAQEVQAYIPRLVKEDYFSLTLDYFQTIPLLLELHKVNIKKLEQLKKKLNLLTIKENNLRKEQIDFITRLDQDAK